MRVWKKKKNVDRNEPEMEQNGTLDKRAKTSDKPTDEHRPLVGRWVQEAVVAQDQAGHVVWLGRSGRRWIWSKGMGQNGQNGQRGWAEGTGLWAEGLTHAPPLAPDQPNRETAPKKVIKLIMGREDNGIAAAGGVGTEGPRVGAERPGVGVEGLGVGAEGPGETR